MKSKSKTAQIAAAHRAYHFKFDSPLILEDSAAEWLMGQPLITILNVAPLRKLLWLPLLAKVRPISTFVIVRSRYTEDALMNLEPGDCRQYLIMGAGFDSWALRNDESQINVFELDHPATQHWKESRILSRLGALPPNLHLVPIDFENMSVTNALSRSEFDTHSKVFVSWLGTIYYLTMDSIKETFASLATICTPGSRIAFDYFYPKSTMTPADLKLFELMDKDVANRGEPLRTLLNAEEIEQILLDTGFSVIEDIPASEIRKRYLVQRTDGLDIPDFVRLCYAERRKDS